MGTLDIELIRAVAPWMGLGFAATLILGYLLDVRGAIVAFALGAIAPFVVYLPSGEMDVFDAAFAWLRARVPFPFYLWSNDVAFLLELTLNWSLGSAFGAALALSARRYLRP